MKTRIAFLLSIILPLSGSARVIEVSEAQKIVGPDTKLSYVAETDGRADFYVFNKTAKKGGFVILAADDVVGNGTVLGYSDNGTFDYEELPENAKWWLKQYQDQIDSLRTHNRTATLPKRTPGTVVVAPLLGETKWNQDMPFNGMCPGLSGGGRCVTGCVATAMAQIMFYHKWPMNGTGSNSYRWEGQTLSVNFSQSEYAWNDMLPKYVAGKYTDAQADAVAKLMYDCGVSVNMGYGPSSGAYSSRVDDALRNYFGYTAAVYLYRGNTADRDWNNRLKQNLQDKKPIYYSGDNEEGGHAFVCDGYDTNDYFHFNFGWGGNSNGYFLSSVAGEFAQRQEIIYNITPGRTALVSDGITYNRLGGSEAEVSFSTGDESYTGEIIIPNTISDSDEILQVTRIGMAAFSKSSVAKVDIPSGIGIIPAGAFFSCNSLDTVVVNWDEPLECDAAVFDSKTYSRAVLLVPEGKVSEYAAVTPWNLFTTITDTSETEGWTEWQPAMDGFGTYTYCFTSVKSAPDTDIPVSVRSSLSDPNKLQYKLDNWFSSSTLIIGLDATTGDCVVKRQSTGFVNGTDEIFVTDYPSSNSSYKYKYYPCTFDSETGTFLMRVLYVGTRSGSYASGTDKFVISGYHVYDIAIDKIDVDKTGNMTWSLSYTDDVAKYAYLVLPGAFNKTEVQSYVEKVSNGELEAVYSTSKTGSVQLDVPDVYTLIVMSVSPSGIIREHAFATAEYKGGTPEWVERYIGTYNYSVWEKVTQNNVTVYQDINNPNSWKMKPMYGNTEFLFRWNRQTNVVQFDEQQTAFKYKGASTTVNDFKNYNVTGDASYFDPEKKTFHFNTYYVSGRFKENGFETFVIEQEIVEEIIYTVSFDAAGGEGDMKSDTVKLDQQYTLPECEFTAPEGKEFDGWNVAGRRFEAGQQFVINELMMQDHLMIITAMWKIADSVRDILFEENEGAVIYDILGQRVMQPVKGHLYIVDGKKILY